MQSIIKQNKKKEKHMEANIFIEAMKALLIGVVEGITEWLPISSTGHMILVDEFVKLNVSDTFLKLFLVVIQIGAIMAVIILFFHKLNPFSRTKTPEQKRGTWRLWGMVVVGCIPAAIIGFLLDDWVSEHFYSAYTVAAMLILYGIIFILLERRNRKIRAQCVRELQGARGGRRTRTASGRDPRRAEAASGRGAHTRVNVPERNDAPARRNANNTRSTRSASAHMAHANSAHANSSRMRTPREEDIDAKMFDIVHVEDIDWKCALKIGLFQCLAIIPGTSRSGAIIIGSMLMRCSRVAATEFAFFLAIPVMLGWGIVKVIKYVFLGSLVMSGVEVVVLIVGVVSAFVVSVFAIKFLIGYIKKHDFEVFGWYRIIVGVIVLVYFLFKMLLGV